MDLPNEREMRLLTVIGGSEWSGRDVAIRYKDKFSKDISYGSVYVTLGRMKEKGWVDVRDDEDEDGRVRFFRLLGPGERALAQGVENFGLLASLGKSVLGGLSRFVWGGVRWM